MKKNYFSLFAAASMMMAVTSCSQEEDFAPVQSGEMTTFKVNLEGVAGSRAAGDGMTATKLYFEVYQGDRKVVDNYGEGKTDHYQNLVDIKDGKAEIKLPLLRGEKYDIMFWAQADGSIYEPANLKEIQVNYNDENGNNQTEANNEQYDAFFFGQSDFQATNNVTDITLKRPFAQLNIGTTKDDWQTAISMIDDTNLPVTTSEVTVTGLADKFNVLTGAATGEVDVTFYKHALLPVKDDQGNTIDVEKFFATVQDVENEYRYLAMNYLLVPGDATSLSGDEVKSNTSVSATFWRGEQKLFTIDQTNLANLPIQRNWRTNILGNLLAADKTFEIVVDPIFQNDHNITMDAASTSEELEAMLKQDLEHIVIDLASVESRATKGQEYIVNVTSHETLAWGTEKTKTITINAKGNTINFKLNDSDWSHVILKNPDAKLIINDATLISSNYNSGHWKRNATQFGCIVELNNVKIEEMGVGVEKDAVLNGVTITPDNGNYSFWIWANGQTVDIDNFTVAAPEGRAIKIADEDADGGLVTLNVKNAKFTSKEKAAILVTSKDGAEITLENIDLSNVTADKFNAVWVDEDRAESFDLVTVKGGSKMLEGDKSKGLENGATIQLAAGVYTLPSLSEYEGITIIGDENGGTVIGGENATTGFASNFGKNTTIKNVTFSGSTNGVRYSYAKGGKSVFENCTFAGGSTYGFHIDQSNGAEFEFTNCTFSGFNAFAGDLTSVTFNNCTFKSNGNYGHTNIWSVGRFNNCTWEDKTSVSGAGDNAKLYFNDVEETYHHEFIGSAESLFAFAATVNSTEKPDSWKGQSVILVDNIDLNNQPWSPIGACNGATYFQGTFDGNGKTISNLNVDKSTDAYGNSSAGLFGWIDAAGATIKNVTVSNATVKGSHWTGVIAGYASGLIENCTVTNATVIGYNVNDEANGDKIGGIVGFMNDQSEGLIGNNVSNSTITGNRDLGGIAGGVAKAIKNMKNNSVNNVVITYSTPKDYASAGIFVSGRTGYVADESNTSSNVTIDYAINSAENLQAALADNSMSVIKLADGAMIEGTFKITKDVTILSSSAENKATIKGRVNIAAIDGTAKFENIKFEINDASTKKEDGKDSFIQDASARNLYQYPAVIMVYATAVTLEGCEFTDLYNTHNVVAVNYGAHAEGKMLTVNNCKFQGYAYAIRSRALVSVTNSEFSLTHSSANPRAVWVWGLGDSTNGKVVFANNKSTDKAIYALQMTATNHPYSNIEFNVQGNTNLVENPFMTSTKCTYSNNSFVEGSLTF